jgi:fucose permease
MLRLVHRISVRAAVRGSFLLAGFFFALAWPAAGWPWLTVMLLCAAAVALVMLDVAGSLPFLMAVKPSERTEMAAVYSSFRDVSGIMAPAVAGLVLAVAPVAAVFTACGAAMWLAWAVAGTLHPRLGQARPSDSADDGETGPPPPAGTAPPGVARQGPR